MAKPKVIARFPVEVIVPLIGTHFAYEHVVGETRYILSLHGPRFEVFKKGTNCVQCGREGKEWRIEIRPDGKLHLNLYAEPSIMMTRDHIVPKSKYHLVYGTTAGRNSVANLQCMCELCNSLKSDALPDQFRLLFTEATWGENNWVI